MKNKKLAFLTFLVFAFIFSIFCFEAYFGGVDMSDCIMKLIVSVVLCLFTIVTILGFVFFGDEKYDYRNAQEISDSEITVVYMGKHKKVKTCHVKYFDDSELQNIAENLGENDIIYVSKNTTLDKNFFESIKYCDYKIEFPESSAKIIITKSGIKNNEQP